MSLRRGVMCRWGIRYCREGRGGGGGQVGEQEKWDVTGHKRWVVEFWWFCLGGLGRAA